MKRAELAHILRAASTIADDPEILLVGSQSILGSYDEDDLPDEAVGSIEADIGEDSGFHAMYGYYAQGVEVDGLVDLPEGWRDRIVVWHSTRPLRGGRTAWSGTISPCRSCPRSVRRTWSSCPPFSASGCSTRTSSSLGSEAPPRWLRRTAAG
jgi:hypothetical protein